MAAKFDAKRIADKYINRDGSNPKAKTSTQSGDLPLTEFVAPGFVCEFLQEADRYGMTFQGVSPAKLISMLQPYFELAKGNPTYWPKKDQTTKLRRDIADAVMWLARSPFIDVERLVIGPDQVTTIVDDYSPPYRMDLAAERKEPEFKKPHHRFITPSIRSPKPEK